ncbi:MAG: sel1 repeat family protein [Deltaproteobacteria bacterium]|nr:sel1 repeat family protein [Deltaproteobacteria bacterium]
MMRSISALLILTLGPIAACASAPDRDGDGIRDPVDACPDSPEDWADTRADGCPAPWAATPTVEALRPVVEPVAPVAPVTKPAEPIVNPYGAPATPAPTSATPTPSTPTPTPAVPVVNPYAAPATPASSTPPPAPATPKPTPATPPQAELVLPPFEEAAARCIASGDALACAVAGGVALGSLEPQKGARYFKRACDLGEPTNCTGLGRLAALRGDDRTAMKLFEQSCSQGELMACGHLADLLQYDRPGARADLVRARALATRSCEGGEPMGCFALAAVRCSADGDRVACVEAARYFLDGDKPQMGARYFKRGCDQGERVSCAGLGRLAAMRGDIRAAARLFEKFCDQGNMEACGQLAGILRRGEGGVRADPVRARALATQSCESGDPEGCFELAELRWDRWANEDELTETDPAPAIPPLDRACTLGWGEACRVLGEIRSGRHDDRELDDEPRWTHRDLPAALRLYERACVLGDATGCERAADAHLVGEGTPRDPAAAEAWRKRGQEL